MQKPTPAHRGPARRRAEHCVCANGGYKLAFAVGAGFVVDGIALALILLRPERVGARDEERA
ncbi:MAG: hypothetical protein M3Q49_06460 [Actinomycetota bacterium]|nr:hypothetical protein [Actinomycetota bacterium]PLS87748.1 MAG: hypothetical protein CYG60_00240 [Actinomycetota bacterium]